MHEHLELLYQALASRWGICVTVSNFSTCQANLYKARREAADPDLDVLQFRHSPYNPENELWIVKGSKKDEKINSGSGEGSHPSGQGG